MNSQVPCKSAFPKKERCIFKIRSDEFIARRCYGNVEVNNAMSINEENFLAPDFLDVKRIYSLFHVTFLSESQLLMKLVLENNKI